MDYQLSFDFNLDVPVNDGEPSCSVGLLTEREIYDIHAETLAYCLDLLPLEQWFHRPVEFRLDNARQRLGSACEDGIVTVTRHFIGTAERDFLRDTLLHEFAHLAAGIRYRHGKKWQLYAELFGCDTRASARMPEAIARHTRARWELWAVLEDGQGIFLRAVHRRNRKYLRARKGAYSVNGAEVYRFIYIDRHEEEKS